MRIDYSEPKQSYVAGPGKSKPRPRKEPVGMISSLVVVTGIIAFLGGFGTGWFFSQKSAKKSFQAAITQNSLENSPRQPNAPASPPQTKPQSAQQAEAGQPQPAPVGGSNQAVPDGQAVPEPSLSFYKTLPSGEKNNIMGSGINTRDEKGKQPLQAAIPSNLNKQSNQGASHAKPVTEKTPGSDKSPVKPHDSGFTVQVASFSLKSEAETLKSRLSSKGYNVAIVESNQGDKGTWYRVRVGKRLEESAAKELSGKLGKGAMVIPDRD